ncbi:MAG: biotin--[acetyl-CoA-carboxylase] ligase [Gemmiger sp.]|nr:biotin--[acetyl-CoA-carboxylase] ligase [Gemmiger sp.]
MTAPQAATPAPAANAPATTPAPPRYLPETDSTNAYAKRHFAEFGALGAVYTTSQTAGRGRLGRAWANAAGRALYYTAVLKTPLAQPGTLPLLASLVVADALAGRYGTACQIKWPNDILLGGKKIVGILCEGVPGGILCGIGINLAQPQADFDAAGLPHATSLALAGVAVNPAPNADPAALATAITAGLAAALPRFGAEGFAPYRQRYKAACINLGRPVQYQGGHGRALDVDEEGRLVVAEAETGGKKRVFTGEVSVQGIYGAV